jgi:nucleoside-diphosphate-sugar epimerase
MKNESHPGKKEVLVTGGAGYVGAVLVPKLLSTGWKVRVLDLYLYGDVLATHQDLKQIKGDIRDISLLEDAMRGVDAIIHLACISNDPSYELNPQLGKSINYDAFFPLVAAAKKNKVRRFIFASSSSVYGVKETADVTEDLPLDPLTDYSKFKALCEAHLLKEGTDDFIPLILRPATVCGYSPRLRLDLTVNILTNHAINRNRINVFGGNQKRPNIHIEDVTDLYIKSLGYPSEKIRGQVFNAGYENHSVRQIADLVKENLNKPDLEIVISPSDDNRSYHISSEKIKKVLGFEPRHSIGEAVRDLKTAFDQGKILNPLTDMRYYNIKTMQAVNLQ